MHQALSSTCKAELQNCNGIPPDCPPSTAFPYKPPGSSATHVFLACFLPKIWKDLGLQAFETRLKGLFYSNLRKKKTPQRKRGWQVEKPGPVSLKITAVLSFSSTDRFQIIFRGSLPISQPSVSQSPSLQRSRLRRREHVGRSVGRRCAEPEEGKLGSGCALTTARQVGTRRGTKSWCSQAVYRSLGRRPDSKAPLRRGKGIEAARANRVKAQPV